jgi:hypothetical protein
MSARFRMQIGVTMSALATLVLASACNDDSSASDAGAARSDAAQHDGHDGSDPGDSGQGASELPDTLAGTFTVKLESGTAGSEPFTSMLGILRDGEVAPPVPVELDAMQDGCELWVPKQVFCAEPCRDGTCTADSVCTPFPTPLSVGTVTVQGLGDELQLEPTGPTFSYQPTSRLPFPPCEEGSEVSVLAEGFELRTPCIAPLVVTDTDPIPLREGEPAEVTWEPAGEAGVSRMQLVVDVSHHGGSKGEILCDVPDTGSFAIPEPLVTRLLDLGVAAFPTVLLRRVSMTHASAYPGVALMLSAAVEQPADIGVPMCISTADCPDGLECNTQTLLCL